MNMRAAFVLAAILAVPVASSANAAEAPALVTEHFMINAVDPGTQLYVRNKRPEAMTQFTAEKTLLFVHGATLPGEATFDYPLEGSSWMDTVARHGWDVYLVDVRGYGRSTRPPEMDRPAADNPPIATTDVAVKDLGSAIDFILRRRDVSRLSLMGWSWGTVITSAYAADNGDKVASLVLYAPGWLRSAPSGQAAGRPLGAYIAAAPSRDRLQAGAPDDRKADLMPAFDTWAASAIATDPVGSQQNPPVLRSPAGTMHDARAYWQSARPYYDPAQVKVPTLIIVAEWDGLNPPNDAQAIFQRLPSGPDKRLVVIGEGTHLVMLEKNRPQLFREVQLFLDRTRRAN